MPQPTDALEDECRRVSAKLDLVLGDMSNGRPLQTRHDGHADQVVELGLRLIRAARGPGHTLSPAPRKTSLGFGG